ncbi:hypothetical protein DER46DRAFT_390541 [Fusarium sp. MPI-SDFR-AT-0072]|nr:hypothetical protein DER46DRAFT_390541 [Fusarium sp. MPI-SDFR-AT-0072]
MSFLNRFSQDSPKSISQILLNKRSSGPRAKHANGSTLGPSQRNDRHQDRHERQQTTRFSPILPDVELVPNHRPFKMPQPTPKICSVSLSAVQAAAARCLFAGLIPAVSQLNQRHFRSPLSIE